MLDKVVLIGASTGGPGQIEKIISSLNILHDTSIIIAQHMVEGFVPSFASRLQEQNINNVLMSNDSDEFKSGNIYMCDGLTTIEKKRSHFYFKKSPSLDYQYNPDINILFNSFVPFTNDLEILCVILTGIGDDGVDACKKLSLNGVRSITENEKSAIVDGMPSRARQEVANIEIYDINDIITKIKEFCS